MCTADAIVTKSINIYSSCIFIKKTVNYLCRGQCMLW